MKQHMPDWLLTQARSTPDRLALRDGDTRWTYAQLAEATDRMAARLAARGVRASDRIAALIHDDARSVALIHAARRLGAVWMPLNRRLAAAEIARHLRTAEAGVVVHDDRERDRAAAALAALSQVDGVRADVHEGTASALVDVRELEDPSEAPERAAPQRRGEVELAAPATIIFTSGTSGRAKGAVLTHANHVASADAWATILSPRPADRWLVCLPLYHVAGLAIVMRASRWGVGLEVHDHFDTERVASALREGATHVSLVVPQLDALLDGPLRSGRPSSLRAILLGGGPISRSLLQRAHALGIPVISTYGMTETASGVATGVLDDPSATDQPGLRPLPGVDMRTDPADGTLLVRGPMVFGGYLADSDEPDAAGPDADGWFETGDIARIDAGGRLHILDRRSDLIISGGENVYPAEIEAVLVAHPDVDDAAVVGRPDDRWGAVPVAAIVEAEGARPSDASLAEWCRSRLARYKVPVTFHRVATVPRSTSGKIQRGPLREALPEEST